MHLRTIFLLSLIIQSVYAFSQLGRNPIINNIKYQTKGDSLIITYQISETKKSAKYLIEVDVIEDTSFRKIGLTSAEGDIGYLGYLDQDSTYQIIAKLSLLNLQKSIFKVNVRVNAYEKLGGPSNALISLVLPGFGGYYVFEKKAQSKYFLLTAASSVLVLATLNARSKYKEIYSRYQKSNFYQGDIDENYRQASKHYKQYKILLYSTMFVWASDVTMVALKGYSNKKNKNLKIHPNQNHQTRLHLYPDNLFGKTNLTVSLNYQF